jgi:hypothetical protein
MSDATESDDERPCLHLPGARALVVTTEAFTPPLNASQSTVCGLAWKRYSRQTPLRDVAPALNGRASLAGVRPSIPSRPNIFPSPTGTRRMARTP